MKSFWIMAIGLALPAAASAQTAEDAAALNMQLAAELCLRHYRSEGELAPSFQQAGFGVSPYMADAGVFEVAAPGLYVMVDTNSGSAACNIQSELVPIPLAEAIGRAVADRLFPGVVQDGAPEHQVGTPLRPCEGIQVFAPQQLIAISYAAAGNSGECIADGTSSILIQM
jgi:hypothetical protein